MCFTKLHSSKRDKINNEIKEIFFGTDYTDNCDYLDEDEIKEVTINKNDLSIIQLNIHGLVSKQHELLKFIDRCNKRKIDIVILLETWLSPTATKKINVAGYEYVGESRKNKKGGGVGFLISNEIKYKTRPDLKIDYDIFENCSIEIKAAQKNIVIGSIYRLPNTNQKEFVSCITNYIEKIGSTYDLIMGMDHNMDLLKSDQNNNTLTFLDTILDKELFPLITRPTRITKSTATLIDNLMVSQDLYHNSLSGVIINDMSDHMPCITILPNIISRKGETITVISRNMKGENLARLKKSLSSIDWSNVLRSSDVNSQFKMFHDTLLNTVDNCCPSKSIEISSKKFFKEPWITKGILNSLNKQKLLYKDLLRKRSEEAEMRYKAYRSTLQRITRNIKRNYYTSKCMEFKSNLKKLWNMINRITGKLNDKSTTIDSLKIDNIEKEDSKTICNEFGTFFSNIGKEYSNCIPKSSKSIISYLDKISRNSSSVFLTPCTSTELLQLINKLPNKKSCGYDGLSNTLIQEIKHEIIEPLTEIFNKSITSGIFPDSMKHAEVVPLYKSGMKNQTTNYHPISLLITILKLL